MTEEPKKQEQNPMDDEFVNQGAGETAAEVSASEPVDTEQAVVPEAEYQRALQELEKANAQSKDYFEGWQRERADFANYKRRTDAERVDLLTNGGADVLKRVLPIVDDFDRAAATLPAELKDQPWVNGVMLVHRKLAALLEQSNVKAIPANPGEVFDPNLHEAITHEESEQIESGHIISEVQRGYKLGERVLRPAMVRVAK